MNYEFDIEGFYEGQWELVCCDATREEALENLQAYRINEPGTLFRIRKVRCDV